MQRATEKKKCFFKDSGLKLQRNMLKSTLNRANADGIWRTSMIFENDRICMLTIINIPIANHAMPPAGLTV